jgi:membrane-associated phospholipid phosphatase
MKPIAAGTLLAVTLVLPSGLAAQSPVDSSANIRWAQLGISAIVLVGVITIDAPVARSIHGTVSATSLTTARQFDRFGDVTGIGPIVGGLALTGVLTHNSKVMQVALHALESVVVASVVAQTTKHVFGRLRPYADADLDATDFTYFSSNGAFPSGHTSAAFAMATTLGDAVNNRWATIGFYGLATGTGWARLAEEKHWVSDVVAGAGVGFISARFVSGRLRVFGLRAPNFIIGPQSAGLRLTF